MINSSNTKYYLTGISLSNSSNYDSSVCILDVNKNIVLLDKFYFTNDIELFLNKNPHIKQSVIAVSIPSDNSMLEGKWRIHCKNYKMVSEGFDINKQNWTNRLSDRCCDILLQLKNEGLDIFRFDINLLRQAYKINAHYLQRTSLDCKSLQCALKTKYGFFELPDNMLPASSLESIMGAMFAYDILHNKLKPKKIFEYNSLDVLNPI